MYIVCALLMTSIKTNAIHVHVLDSHRLLARELIGRYRVKGHKGNPYIKKQGDQWVITQKGTGKVLSHHDTKADAEASFRAMEMSKHGG